MARTYRCRHTCPNGWEVRDDDHVYFKAGFRTKNARWRASQEFMREAREAGVPGWLHWRLFDVLDPEPPKFRRRFTNREKKAERKADHRSYRAKVKNLMAHERYDNILPYHRTSGWLSW